MLGSSYLHVNSPLEIDTVKRLGHVQKIPENMIHKLAFGWILAACLLQLVHWYYTNAEINKDDLKENHREEMEFSDASQGEAI